MKQRYLFLGLFVLVFSGYFCSVTAQSSPDSLEIVRESKAKTGIFRWTLSTPEFASDDILEIRGAREQIFAVFSDPYSPEIDYLGRFHPTEELGIYIRLKNGKIHKMLAPLTHASESKDPQTLERDWARALLAEYTRRASHYNSSFYQYAAMTTARRYSLEKELQRLDRTANIFNNPFRTTPDLYSIFTGATAIQETLQLDMMRQVNPKIENYTLPAKELTGPTISAHPFEEMLKGRTFQRFSLAQYAPHDFYYIHAVSVSSWLQLLDETKVWGTHFLRHYLTSGRDNLIKERYQKQLALKLNPLMRPFYSMVIEDMAVVGSDLYLAEGSDVTLIFQLKQPDAFRKQIEEYRVSFQRQYPQHTRTTQEHQGKYIDQLTTPDRTISSFLVYTENNVAIISNSLKALKIVLDTKSGKNLALYDTAEFKYIRSVFPASKETESVFFYLSDPFIRNLVGPKSKILEQRRVRSMNSLKIIQNASLLHLLEKGERPSGLSGLVQEGYLQNHYLACSFNGNYSLDSEGLSGHSSVLGSSEFMTPLLELEWETVSAREKREYEQFLIEYQNYWREFFDPIGIRVHLKDGIKIETVVLPLINNSLYNNLQNWIGGEPLILEDGNIDPKTIFLTRFKWKPFLKQQQPLPRLQNLFQQMGLSSHEQQLQFLDALGDSVSLGLVDHEMIFGFNLSGEIAQSLRRGGSWNTDWMLLAPMIASFNLPIYASIPLRDPVFFEEALNHFTENHLKKMASASGENAFFKIDPYTMVAPSGLRYGVWRVRLMNSLTLRLYYGIAHNILYLASQPKVLEALLSAPPLQNTDIETVANFKVVMIPENYQQVSEEFEQAWAESSREACLKNTDSLQMYADLFRTGENTNLGSFAESLEHLRYYCPAGGQYRGSVEGFASCSLHHYRFAPQQPMINANNASPFSKTSRVSVTLRFIPEGLYTAVDIRNKK